MKNVIPNWSYSQSSPVGFFFNQLFDPDKYEVTFWRLWVIFKWHILTSLMDILSTTKVCHHFKIHWTKKSFILQNMTSYIPCNLMTEPTRWTKISRSTNTWPHPSSGHQGVLGSPEKSFSDLSATIGELDNWNMSEILRQEIVLDEMSFFCLQVHQVGKIWKFWTLKQKENRQIKVLLF